MFLKNRVAEGMAALDHSLIVHDCKLLESLLPINLQNLKELEDHILIINCPHPHTPHLQDFIFDENSG